MKETVLRTYHTRPVPNKAATIHTSKISDFSTHFVAIEIEEVTEDELHSLVKKAVCSNYKISFQSFVSVIIADADRPQGHSFSEQYSSYFPPEKYIFQQVFRV